MSFCIAVHVSAKSKFLQDLVLSDVAGYGSPNQSLKEQGLQIDRGDCLAIMERPSGNLCVPAISTVSRNSKSEMETKAMNDKTITNARVRNVFAALVLACALGTNNHAMAQVTPPPVPDTIAVQAGNSPYLVGHAFGSQGYTCLPTSSGGTAWNPAARPEATLFSDLFGQQFQIITHFQSINVNPKPGVTVPLSGNATWQGSFDSSRVWAVKVNGIDPSSEIAGCSHTGSIQCLLLQSVGTKKGPTGGNLLANTTFIQRLNTNGGAVPTTSCTVGQAQLVPYTADYFFYRADQQ
jgi:hypothetical protein